MYFEGGIAGDAGAAMSPDALLYEPDNPAEIIHLTVIVQDKAIVSVNGEPTDTMGTIRPYIVRGLEAGKKYRFVVEGLFKTETGAEYAAKEMVTVVAGSSQQVVLQLRRRNRTPPPPVILAVPVAPPVAAK